MEYESAMNLSEKQVVIEIYWVINEKTATFRIYEFYYDLWIDLLTIILDSM